MTPISQPSLLQIAMVVSAVFLGAVGGGSSSEAYKKDATLTKFGYHYDTAIYDLEKVSVPPPGKYPSELVQGDMVFYHESQFDETGIVYPWPKGTEKLDAENYVIPYRIEKQMDDKHHKQLEWVFAYVKEVTNVRFAVSTSLKHSYTYTTLAVLDGDGCYATVGYPPEYDTSVSPVLSLSPDLRCVSRRNILHLVGHTIGLLHEHQRVDRSDHLLLHLLNLDSNNHFNILTQGNLYHNYDHSSVMHVSPYYHSSGDGPTYVPLLGRYVANLNILLPLFSSCDLFAIHDIYPSPHIMVERCVPNELVKGIIPTEKCHKTKSKSECETLCSTKGGDFLEDGLCEFPGSTYLPALPSNLVVQRPLADIKAGKPSPRILF